MISPKKNLQTTNEQEYTKFDWLIKQTQNARLFFLAGLACTRHITSWGKITAKWSRRPSWSSKAFPRGSRKTYWEGSFTMSSLFDRPWRRYVTTIIRLLFATLLACSRHLDSLVRRIEKAQTRKKQREETEERRRGPRPPHPAFHAPFSFAPSTLSESLEQAPTLQVYL